MLINELKEFLVPSTEIFCHCGTCLAGFSRSVAECGGDWWTARRLRDDKILVLIADVMGHDVGSAVIMGVGKAICELMCSQSDTVRCGELLRTMNSSVFEAGRRGEMTMTCFVSILDPETRTVSFASAGHPQPLLIRRDTTEADTPVFHCLGDPLGMDEATTYTEHSVQLEKDDLVLWYTDGVTEGRNRQGKRLSERRLIKLINSAPEPRVPDVLRDRLVAAIARFHQDAPPDDDITFVIGRIG